VWGSRSSLLEGPQINSLGTCWPWTRNCMLVMGLSIGLCILRQLIHIIGPLGKCQVQEMCGQEEKFSYRILCYCPALAGHRLEIFGFAWLQLWILGGPQVDSGSSNVVRTLWRSLTRSGVHNGPSSGLIAEVTEIVHPRSTEVIFMLDSVSGFAGCVGTSYLCMHGIFFWGYSFDCF
jgi:hypothetical protein